MTRYFLRLFSYIAIAFVIVLTFFFAALQTPYAKNKIAVAIADFAKKNEWDLSIHNLRGRIPFSWDIETLNIKDKNLGEVALKEIHCSLSPFALLKGKWVISSLDIQEARCHLLASDHGFDPETLKSSFPILSHFRTLCIHQLYINPSDPTSHFYFYAHYSPKRVQKFLTLKVLHKNSHSSFNVASHFNSKEKYGEIEIFADITNTAILNPLVILPIETSLFFETRCEGPLAALSQDPGSKRIHGEITGSLKPFPLSKAPYLEREWGFRSYFGISGETLEVKEGFIESDLLSIQSSGSYDFGTKNTDYTVQGEIFNLRPFNPHAGFEGNLHFYAKGEKDTLNLSVSSESLMFSDQELYPLNLEGTFVLLQDHLWAGALQGKAGGEKFPVDFSLKLTLNPFQKADIDTLEVTTQAGYLRAQGVLAFSPWTLKGTSHLELNDLASLTHCLGGVPIEGKLKASLCSLEEKSGAHLTLHAEGLRMSDAYLSALDVDAFIDSPFEHPSGSFRLILSRFSSSSYYIDQLRLEAASNLEGSWPFSASAQGNWKMPFSCNTQGSLKVEPTHMELKIEAFSGQVLGRSFHLEAPAIFHKTEGSLALNRIHIKTDLGNIEGSLSYTPTDGSVDLNAEHIPLELLTLASPKIGLSGQGSIILKGSATHNDVQGSLRLILENADIVQSMDQSSKEAKGTLEMHVLSEHLQVFAELGTSENEAMSVQATLPISYRHFPFSFSINQEKKVAADITLKGHIEKLCDFIDLGPNRITGEVNTRLLLSNTLSNPFLQGNLELKNGHYESYNLGTYLEDVSFKVHAEKNIAKLTEFYAVDRAGGSVKAEGEIQLNQTKHFPYTFVVDVNHLEYLDLDLMRATFTGPVYLTGDTENLSVRCNLIIDEGLYQLAEHQNITLPQLDVEFIHQPKKVYRANSKSPLLPFTLDLDAELSADSKVFVNGKGLSSEWQGHVTIKSARAGLLVQGKLKVVKGEYLFAGKRFKLQEGDIYFNQDSSPFVNVKGTVEISGNSILLHLQGPLSEPTLTFTSMPPLPTSSILSYILFNKDISEISTFQAILLAKTLVDLSTGSNTDLLDKIRMSLGVDRFNIVSDPEGGDEVSLQIGKYLTRGVLVTLSQSKTSSNVMIEVDLKHGFVFQAESQNQEEGKFSLKWHHNY